MTSNAATSFFAREKQKHAQNTKVSNGTKFKENGKLESSSIIEGYTSALLITSFPPQRHTTKLPKNSTASSLSPTSHTLPQSPDRKGGVTSPKYLPHSTAGGCLPRTNFRLRPQSHFV